MIDLKVTKSPLSIVITALYDIKVLAFAGSLTFMAIHGLARFNSSISSSLTVLFRKNSMASMMWLVFTAFVDWLQ